ncbi:hypothetical protein Tco_0810042 [Tanacetum coccineum]
MMQSCCEIVSQRREQEAILLQEQAVEEKQELLAEEQAANPSEPSLVSYFYNADCDNISTPSSDLITYHLTKVTIPETESDKLIKSSVENLVPTPSESEDLSKDLSDIESEYNMPVCDDFITLSNPLFDADNDFFSSDDKSFSDEDFDSLLEEFSGELAHIDLISLGINEADFDPEEDIHLVEKLLYENSSPRPLKEFNSENSDVIIESFSPSHIPVEDSDSLMEEIDLFLTPDDSMPPGIENDDYDSEGDILFLEELLSKDSLSLPENESFHFDVPSSPCPPEKPPDDDEIEPDTGVLTAKVLSSESPMMIYGGNIPTLDVPIALDIEASRARGFVLRSLELQSLA